MSNDKKGKKPRSQNVNARTRKPPINIDADAENADWLRRGRNRRASTQQRRRK